MRLDKLDLNLFVVFDAIYVERNITRVAMRLNLTQPAVSNALGRLRNAFDDPLFVRMPSGMQPTPVADSVIADVRKALGLLQRSVEENAHFDPISCEKVFGLGMNDLAETLLLPNLHRRLQAQAPRAAISSYYSDRGRATAELKAGEIDLLIDAPMVNARDLDHIAMASFPYVVAMHSDHPLAKKKMTLAHYLSYPHVHVSSRRKGRGQVDVALHALGKRRTIAMRVQSYLLAAHMVDETQLLWTVPKALLKDLPLKYKAVPFSIEPLSWLLYWPKSATHDPANRWLREQVLSAAQDFV